MRSLSPVIATVLIVATAMAISVAVALWMTGLKPSFTGIEQLEIKKAKLIYVNDTLTIELIVKNTGTKEAFIEHVYIDGIEPNYTIDINPVEPGETTRITMSLVYKNYIKVKPIIVKIMTSSGNNYTITFP